MSRYCVCVTLTLTLTSEVRRYFRCLYDAAARASTRRQSAVCRRDRMFSGQRRACVGPPVELRLVKALKATAILLTGSEYALSVFTTRRHARSTRVLFWTPVSTKERKNMRADRQTDRHTDTLVAILRTPIKGSILGDFTIDIRVYPDNMSAVSLPLFRRRCFLLIATA